jgi:hypothetical protein
MIYCIKRSEGFTGSTVVETSGKHAPRTMARGVHGWAYPRALVETQDFVTLRTRVCTDLIIIKLSLKMSTRAAEMHETLGRA